MQPQPITVLPWNTPESKAKRRATMRAKAIGKTRVRTNGYRYIMTADGERAEHRMVMEQMLGRPLTRREFVHHCNHDKLDNRSENLELMSPQTHSKMHSSARMADPAARAHLAALNTGKTYGRTTREKHAQVWCGSRSPSAKLHEADIPDILARLAAGESISSIARTYQIDRCAIRHIRDGTGWQHIPR